MLDARPLDSPTHLACDGGSVLFAHPALADLLRHRLHRRAAAETAGRVWLRYRPASPLARPESHRGTDETL